MKSTTLAIVISISTICSTYASPNKVYPQQNNHLRTQSRLNSKNEAIVRGDETEVSHHRKLQPDEDKEDEVADLLEEVVELLKETDTPTYSPTKTETQEVRCVLCCYILLQCIRYVQLFTYTHS